MHRPPSPPRLDRRRKPVCLAALLTTALVVVATGRAPATMQSGVSGSPSVALAQTASDVCSSEWLRGLRLAAGAPALARSDVVEPGMDSGAPARTVPPGRVPVDEGARLAQDPSSRYPNDPYFRLYQKDSLLLMGALDAWDTSRGASDVTVAVISTGAQLDHPDLAAKLWRNSDEAAGNGVDDDGNGYVDDLHGWNFPAQSNDPTDIPRGRGTMMAGIVGAATNNNEGIAGTSWGARIMPLKTLVLQQDEQGARAVGTVSDIVEAVCYAANNGADIIVFGGYLQDPSNVDVAVQRLEQAVRFAYVERGAVLVAAAGDCGTPAEYCPSQEYGGNPPIFPAAFDKWVIGAQSFGVDYAERADASRGYWVDISAPGEGFYTTISYDPPYVRVRPGTHATSDFAAAHIAGVLATMRSVNPSLSPYQLEERLCATANRPRGVPFSDVDGRPHNDAWGCGYVNYDRVLDMIEPQMRVKPTTIRQFTDGSEPWPRLVFENPYLRASRWMVNAEDAGWLRSEAARDGADGVARAVLTADLDRLAAERGSPLQAGDPPARATLRACPLGDYADRPYLCQSLSYELTFVAHIHRGWLPSVVR